MPSRRQQAEIRREQIIDAALKIFSEKGYDGASIRDIAEEVGVSEGLMYHYFSSKEELLQTCWRERTWGAQLEMILSDTQGKSVPEVLQTLVKGFLNSLYSCASSVRMCLAEMQRNSDVATVQIEHIDENQKILINFLKSRQNIGEISYKADVQMAAGMLMGCAFSLFILWNRLSEPEWIEKVDAFTTSGVNFILHGLYMP
jgi:AcrR family transcriptional regulator